MAKPIIKPFSPPDASGSFNIPFHWSGERAYSNRLVITNNTTNAVVYDQTIESFNLYHTVPAGTLTNGGTWIALISVFYRDPRDTSQFLESEQSEKKIFPTLTTPIFSFADLDISGINTITSPTFQASIHYMSEEEEKIESYIF